MTSGTNSHPFTAREKISREQLLAYAEGRSTPLEQFDVELAATNDPLLSDALEGLMMPGAIDGMDDLGRSKPKFRSSRGWSWMFALLIVVGFLLLNSAEDPGKTIDRATTERSIAGLQEPIFSVIEERPIILREKASAITAKAGTIQEKEKELVIPIDRTTSIDRLEPIPIDLAAIGTIPDRRIKRVRRERSGLQLHYLHDLKLIHPKELYPFDPKIELVAENLSADRPDRTAQDLKILQPIKQSYLEFMDEALRYFAEGDPAKCVAELQILLDHYPDDVNALFYSGLCQLQLKKFRMASQLLSTVIDADLDVFLEEAEFYHAEAIDGSGDLRKARKEFQRIADKGGFYSERARAKIQH